MIYLLIAKVGDRCPLPGAADNSFFGFPHWWKYLSGTSEEGGHCAINFHFPGDMSAVGLGVIDILLRLAGLIAVFAIIWAGISYMTSVGDAQKATSARKSIINALIGLAIVIVAIGVVSFIGRQIK